MRKNEIKNSKDNALITDYVRSYSKLVLNMNLGMGVNQIGKHCDDLENELLRRGILTSDDIKILNS